MLCKSNSFVENATTFTFTLLSVIARVFLCVRGTASYQSMITAVMIILFDEIYMSSPYILNKIRVFCNEHLNFIVIGSGDVKQLPSIEPFTNNQNGEEYVDNCIDIIFNYNIFLQICKRVGGKDTEEGERNRTKLNEIYDDFWETYLDWKLWIETPFSYTKDVMTSKNNIAYTVYTNIRCQAVATEVRKRLNKKKI